MYTQKQDTRCTCVHVHLQDIQHVRTHTSTRYTTFTYIYKIYNMYTYIYIVHVHCHSLRLSLEVQVSHETSLEGRLLGVEVEDLTPIGRKYRDILTMGGRGGKPRGEMGKEQQEQGGESYCNNLQPEPLNFSVHISPQASGWSLSPSNNVHVTVFVPSIHYTHSVNLVYEMEMFVSEFQEISRAMLESFSSTAVGVAKGLVKEKSQFAEQIGKLSTSLGPHSANFPQPTGGPKIETVDGPLNFSTGDRLYLKISVQSPVITLPSSLHRDKCLIAYLGEITVENKFISDHLTTTPLSTSLDEFSSEKEQVTLKINNMSLHATHDAKSRALLVANKDRDMLTSSGQWWKVVQETSIVVTIERKLKEKRWDGEDKDGPPTIRVGGREMESGEDGDTGDADVKVTGWICDPLLIRLPKEVFDQIRVTLKHGIHRSLPRKRTIQPAEKSKISSNSVTSSTTTSQSIPKSESSLKSETNRETSDKVPSIYASFSLPRLSLELKHTIDTKQRDLVYISFEEFSVRCHKSGPHLVSLDLALRSIMIEDLLQEKESKYRYLLASSSKPLPVISPVASASPPSLGLSLSSAHLSPLTRPLLTLPHLISSTPRIPVLTDSPLRTFTPRHSDGDSHHGLKPDGTRDKPTSHDHNDTSFTTPKTSRKQVFDSKLTSRQTSSTSQKTSFEDEIEEAGSTVLGETTGYYSNGHRSNQSDDVGLLSIKAMFVDKESPEFKTKYNSVSCTYLGYVIFIV